METCMNDKVKFGLTIVLIAIMGLFAGAWAITVERTAPLLEVRPAPPPYPSNFSFRGDLEVFYIAKTVISSINLTLVIILLGTYISLYRKTKSEFVVGLIVFALVLLFYTLVSNPIVIYLAGFRPFGLGPFAMLPDMFALIALGVLLYLTLKY
ncbi:MAG: hypothetical protein N3E52_00615 [Candidatus Bathyarchaeota archaeon]|nr:hypothetical protein [Candidatus Bathyarchaeota archaeon]